MISAGTLLRAPSKPWTVTMKPTGHSRKAQQQAPEVFTVEAGDRAEVIQLARDKAFLGGFSGFAITDIREGK